MVFTNDELDRLVDEDFKNRVIQQSTYCAECGYNLRGLPFLYSCPECGNSYNARPRGRFGIFEPQQAEFPIHDILGVAIFAGIAAFILWDGVAEKSTPYCLAGIGFAMAGLFFLARTWRRMGSLARARKIAMCIAEQEDE
ncbi:MAG: hypothetical protein HY287_01770 [Planctomycetes bacterium]|nr:hypothetical protein [Planctomycetota bacterium]MBI3833037.1 hypothetical protein [Planctomycetota bacterium]